MKRNNIRWLFWLSRERYLQVVPTPRSPRQRPGSSTTRTSIRRRFPMTDIATAATLDVYFEHASVGDNICGGIDALGGRYTSGRVSE